MDERAIELCIYRVDKAVQCLESAKLLVRAEDYCSAANRAYYAIFHSIRSILALDQVDFSKHSGVMAYFQRKYIKTGIFDIEFSKIITQAFEIRSDADYDDYYVISKVDVEKQISNAEKFIDGIRNYIKIREGVE